MNTARVVVIGAGPAGIAAATKLLELGFQKVVIIEAENRIGGRIHTVPFADNVVDLGAQWCHGEKDNVVYELATKHNLLESTGDVYEKYECIRSNKEVLPHVLSQRLKNIANDTMVTRRADLNNYKGSFGNYLTDQFDAALSRPENADIDVAIANEFFDNYRKFENSVEASDTLNDVSGKGYVEYWDCDGDLLLNWKDKGYLRFLQLLMKSSDRPNDLGVLNERVYLEKPVEKIQWDEKKGCIFVKCENSDPIEADHVIATMSLGVLKERHHKIFTPSLPEEKVVAIDSLGFGTVNKFFIEFPEKFWPDGWTGFTLLWREEDAAKIRGTEDAWMEDVFGFYVVSYQPRVLAGWIIGANGRQMETLRESVVLEGCMYLFRKFLSWDIPDPIDFKRTIWYHNENFRGSYSYRSVLTEKMQTGANDLAAPITDAEDKPVVQFAGEATSEHYYSTVHGAVESGWREAHRLAKFYNKMSPRSQL